MGNGIAEIIQKAKEHRAEQRWRQAWAELSKLFFLDSFDPKDVALHKEFLEYDFFHQAGIVGWFAQEYEKGEEAARAALEKRNLSIDRSNLDFYVKRRTALEQATAIQREWERRQVSLTVILNVYKRPYTFKEQLMAVLHQTRIPEEVWVWVNGAEHASLVDEIIQSKDVQDLFIEEKNKKTRIETFKSSQNLGVWPRFFVGLNAKTDFLCVFDDDTIPGPRWFENCLETEKDHKGVLGTIGVVYDSRRSCTLTAFTRKGWDMANEDTELVDYLGHSWFFRRETLSLMALDLPPKDMTLVAGEDMHFGYVCQKYGKAKNLKMWVPPHPQSDKSLWGSMPEKAWAYGTDANAISFHKEAYQKFSRVFQHFRQNGFVCVRDPITGFRELDSIMHLQHFKTLIKQEKYFCIIRPSDGEWCILNNVTVYTQDRWQYTKTEEEEEFTKTKEEEKKDDEKKDVFSTKNKSLPSSSSFSFSTKDPFIKTVVSAKPQNIKQIKSQSLIKPSQEQGQPIKPQTIKSQNVKGSEKEIVVKKNKKNHLRVDLDEAMRTASMERWPAIHVGLPCCVCNAKVLHYYLSTYPDLVKDPYKLTYANMFINKNWQDFIAFLQQWVQDQFQKDSNAKRVVYIGPGGDNPSVRKLFSHPLDQTRSIIKRFISVDERLVDAYNQVGRQFVESTLKKMKSEGDGNMFLISAGPVAKILAVKGHLQNPNNWYLDVGSAVDLYFKESSNRGFIDPDGQYSNIICSFVFGHE